MSENLLERHAQAVGENKLGLLWWTCLREVHINLARYNNLIDAVIQDRVLDLVQDLGREITTLNQDLERSGNGSREAVQRELTRAQAESQILTRLSGARNKLVSQLGDYESQELFRKGRIRPQIKYKAFQNATRKFEFKTLERRVNYLVRDVVTARGEAAGQDPERQLVREEKDSEGRRLRFEPVARFLFQEGADGEGELAVVVLDLDDPRAEEAAQQPREAFEIDCAGASASRFKTVVEHLTGRLSPIPVHSAGFVYYCPVDREPVVEFARALVSWVDLNFRTGEGRCEFQAVPLLDCEDSRELVSSSAKDHLTSRLAKASAQLHEAVVAWDTGQVVDEAMLGVLRREVVDLQGLVNVYLGSLGGTAGELQQGLKALIGHFKKFAGV